jgi:hypothetical protein
MTRVFEPSQASFLTDRPSKTKSAFLDAPSPTHLNTAGNEEDLLHMEFPRIGLTDVA